MYSIYILQYDVYRAIVAPLLRVATFTLAASALALVDKFAPTLTSEIVFRLDY